MPSNYNVEWYTKSECGPKCRSIHCVRELNAVITKANIHQFKDYVWSHCPTSCQRYDGNGRYPLHVAASCGKIEILDWLITTFECDLNVQDEESSWTPLHRAIYYGRLACAILLIEYGANLWFRDKDGFTAMDITMVDCTPWVKSLEFSRQTYEMPSVLSVADPSEAYTWGSNDNFILGHGNPRGGKLPETLEYFSKRKINIKQVSMAKFHTVFVTVDGTVFTCGHGEGGRLGNGRQDVCLEPTEMSFSPGNKVVATAAAVNHTLLVTENGQLYSCGLNKYHVLGSSTNNDRELTPIKVQTALRSVKVIGCAAAKLHSVVWTDNHAVFTFGTNAGQLGHSKADLFIKKPRQVSGVYNEEDQIASVHACDSATVVATRQGTVYLLQKYVCRKIISKQLDIEQIQVGGGKLDTSTLAQVDQRLHATHMQIKEESLRVLVRKKSGDVLSWSKAHGTLDRCKFNMKQPLLIKEVILCNHGHTALLITNTGQAFMAKFGQWKPPKPPKRHSATSLSKGYDSCLDMLDADAVQEFLLEQVSGVFRAHSGSLSPKGKSGALLQCEPCNFITEVPIIQESVFVQNMKSLFDGMHENDSICDIIVIATDAKGNKLLSIPCHKFILSSKSPKLRKVIQERCDYDHDDEGRTAQKVLDTLIFEQCDPVVLKNMIQFIYCETCDLLYHGVKVSRLVNGTHKENVSIYWLDTNSNCMKPIHEVDLDSSAFAVYRNLPKLKQKVSSKHETAARNALSQFKLLAKTLGINRPYFNQFSIQEGIISRKMNSRQQVNNLSYDRHKLREFCDIQLECNDDVIVEAHKCVLVTRVEFFRSMLISHWAEKSSSVSKVPIQSKVFGHVLEYVYKDQIDVLDNISSVEVLCDIMAAADQFLLQRLKDIAQVQVASKLTLKNVAAVMEFSSMFNCEQLFKTCQQFICHNLPSLMHTPLFYSVDYKTLEECEEFYRANISSVFYRIITPSSEAPTLPDIEPEADETTPTTPYDSSSTTDKFSSIGQGHGSPQKKKGVMARRRSSGSKRKSVSKQDGVTLSELLEQKDGIIDSLLQRITATSDLKSTNLPTVPDHSDEHIEDTDNISNRNLEKTLMTTAKEPSVLKSPERVQNSTGQALQGDALPLSFPGRPTTSPGVMNFRDIMASQARKTPAKPPNNVSIRENAKGPWSPGSVSQQYSTTAPCGVVPLKSKKLSQKQRKRLEQEATKKKAEEAVIPNAWGVTQRAPSSSRSFWDVMMEQSSPVHNNSATHAKSQSGRLAQGNQRQKM